METANMELPIPHRRALDRSIDREADVRVTKVAGLDESLM
jgi:hypothetical protein